LLVCISAGTFSLEVLKQRLGFHPGVGLEKILKPWPIRLKRVFVGLPGVFYFALTGKLAALKVLSGGFDAHACQVHRLIQVIYLVFHLKQSPYLSVCDHRKSLNLRKSDSLFSPAAIRKF
jgi:hypothetical protein